MATKKQLEVLAKARARKKQLSHLREMREARKKVITKRKTSSSISYQRGKAAIRRLRSRN